MSLSTRVAKVMFGMDHNASGYLNHGFSNMNMVAVLPVVCLILLSIFENSGHAYAEAECKYIHYKINDARTMDELLEAAKLLRSYVTRQSDNELQSLSEQPYLSVALYARYLLLKRNPPSADSFSKTGSFHDFYEYEYGLQIPYEWLLVFGYNVYDISGNYSWAIDLERCKETGDTSTIRGIRQYIMYVQRLEKIYHRTRRLDIYDRPPGRSLAGKYIGIEDRYFHSPNLHLWEENHLGQYRHTSEEDVLIYSSPGMSISRENNRNQNLQIWACENDNKYLLVTLESDNFPAMGFGTGPATFGPHGEASLPTCLAGAWSDQFVILGPPLIGIDRETNKIIFKPPIVPITATLSSLCVPATSGFHEEGLLNDEPIGCPRALERISIGNGVIGHFMCLDNNVCNLDAYDLKTGKILFRFSTNLWFAIERDEPEMF